jgi:hypothetical protein
MSSYTFQREEGADDVARWRACCCCSFCLYSTCCLSYGLERECMVAAKRSHGISEARERVLAAPPTALQPYSRVHFRNLPRKEVFSVFQSGIVEFLHRKQTQNTMDFDFPFGFCDDSAKKRRQAEDRQWKGNTALKRHLSLTRIRTDCHGPKRQGCRCRHRMMPSK